MAHPTVSFDEGILMRGLRQRGYNLVALVVLLAVMSIAVTVALPAWSAVIQREREEELLFRGWQYAEAIRVFQARHGRLPVQLKELYEVKPRVIRQLWEDPLSDSGEWQLIIAGTPKNNSGQQQGGQVVGGGVGPSERRQGGPQVRDQDREQNEGPTAFGENDFGKSTSENTIGPIEGVRPTAKGSSFRSFLGKTEYSEWEFRASMLAAPPVGPDGVPRSPRIGALSLSPTESLRVQAAPGTGTPDGKPVRRTPDGS
jgi:type II secretory pathway pseudopilin PulG